MFSIQVSVKLHENLQLSSSKYKDQMSLWAELSKNYISLDNGHWKWQNHSLVFYLFFVYKLKKNWIFVLIIIQKRPSTYIFVVMGKTKHPKKDACVGNGSYGVETSLDELLWWVVYNVDHRRSLKDLDWLPMGNSGSNLIENKLQGLKNKMRLCKKKHVKHQ